MAGNALFRGCIAAGLPLTLFARLRPFTAADKETPKRDEESSSRSPASGEFVAGQTRMVE